jgi:putative membrane protein
MIRLLASTVLHLLANAAGLLIAAAVLPGFSINGVVFVTAVLIFTVTEVIAGPLIIKIALKNLPALVGGIALVTTLVGLVATDIFSDGLTISGLSTWVLATLIVWLGALIAGLALPLVIFKKTLDRHKAE